MTAQNVMDVVASLDDEDIAKVYDFASFLKYVSDKEDAEDMQAVRERADEPDVPFDVVQKELGLV